MKQIRIDTTDEGANEMKEIKPFWVYIDKPTITVKIHKSSCKFCNNGQGLHGHRKPDNWWKGFDYREEAWEHAKVQAQTMIVEPTTCKKCLP